jgi:TonB-dependent starch-binding outer membrane protein SusC
MKPKLNGFLVLLLALITQMTFAQERAVSGIVTNVAGMPMPGVTVLIRGNKTGTQTGFDGAYTIKALPSDVLVFSFIGMKTQERNASSNSIFVKLMDATQQLVEVVVVGYAKQDKRKMIQSVSVVNADKIKDVYVSSVQDILQGQASGVQVVNSSGILGSASIVKIRGVSSLNSGGRPLYVVDGVPLNDDNLTAAQGGQALNPISDINPNDIETMTVLKDVAASAIYGSRGANGVILITTKLGKKNQDAKLTLDFRTSFTQKTDLLRMMNADQYRSFISSNPANATTPAAIGLNSYDWADAATRTGVSKEIDMSLTGGSDKSTYFIGGTYADQDGFIIGNGLKRNGVRLNLSTDAKPWLKIGMNTGISEVLIDRIGSENNTAAPLTSAYLQQPFLTPYDNKGNLVRLDFIPNIVAIEKLNTNNSNTFRVTGNLFADIKINNYLNFRTDFGLDRSALEEFRRDVDLNTPGGSASDYQAVQNKYVLTNTLNFSKKFNQVHSLNVLVGMTNENTSRRDINVSGTGFASDDLINVTSAVTKVITDNSTTASRLTGIFSRLNYDYNSKYLLEASVRRDGSSRFGVQNQYGVFWSVGGAWVVSQENFLKDNTVLSNLKFKANYGLAGNDRIGDFSTREDTSGGTYPNYNSLSGLGFFRFPNPDLKWESSKSYDLGLELGLFRNRLRINVDYYNKQTDNLILNQLFAVADNKGIRSKQINAGKAENKGFEIEVSADVFKQTALKWTTSFNINLNKNKILELNADASIDSDGNRYLQGSVNQRAIVGYSANTFYLIPYLGVNPKTGDAEWLGKNGLPTIAPTANDRAIVGDANPKFTGGFSNNFKYNNFDLNILMNFSYGNDIFVDGLRFTEDARYASAYNKAEDLLNVWQNVGDVATTPKYTSTTFGTAQQRSTRQLRDGSFARLKTITLGYTLPLENTPAGKFISNVKFYFTAQNLFTFKKNGLTGIDPEVTNSIGNLVQGETFFTPPQSKTFLFGTRITF